MRFSSRQLCLDFFPMPRRHPLADGTGGVEYFAAILPDLGNAREATLLADALHHEHHFLKGPRRPELLHLTLCKIGCHEDSPGDVAAAMSEAVKDIHLQPFTLVLDRLMTYDTPSKHVVLCGKKGQQQFRMLHIQLAKALRRIGFKIRLDCGCQPHMTLFYRGKDIGKRQLDDPFVIEASQIFLVRNHVGEGRHEHFGPWPLRAH
jgi:2'-5' RNA ligase